MNDIHIINHKYYGDTMNINKKIALLILPISFSFFSASVFSAPQQCLRNALITAVEVGTAEASSKECPDDGNCIRFQYINNAASGMPASGRSFVHYQMNLNDGQKGMAMYDLLKTAMIMGYRVEAYSDISACNTSSPSISAVKVYGG